MYYNKFPYFRVDVRHVLIWEEGEFVMAIYFITVNHRFLSPFPGGQGLMDSRHI